MIINVGLLFKFEKIFSVKLDKQLIQIEIDENFHKQNQTK